MPTPAPRLPGVLPGVSVREAAQQLAVSESDIRRRVKRGEIDAGYYDRPGGTILRVFLPAPEATPDDVAPSESEAVPEPRQDVSEALRILEERLAFADTLIRANGDSLARQAEQIDGLHRELRAESAARATAEGRATLLAEMLDAERARAADLAEALERERARSWLDRLLRRE